MVKEIKFLKKKFSDPFTVEDLRSSLAEQRRILELRKLYGFGLPEIKDINKRSFWNVIFANQNNDRNDRMADIRVREVIKILKKKEGNVLDIGFGLCPIERKLLRNKTDKLHFFGIDISDFAVKQARERFSGTFLKASILKIPFSLNTFDIIIALEVLEHIPPRNTFKAFGEIRRVLKDNGLLVISVPLNEDLESLCRKGLNPSGHTREYTPCLIKAELEMAGFLTIEEKYFYAFRNMYWFKNLLQRTFFKNKWKPNNILLVAQKK